MSGSPRVAVVTGAGRGIGAAIALQLASDGFDVTVNDISKESAADTASKIEKMGRRAFVSIHDVSKMESAAAMISETRSQLGRVDALVNNAGITRDALLVKMTQKQWDEVIGINLTGVFNCGQAAAKVMMEQKSGCIVNLASIAWLGNIGQTNYAASKAGVVAMTKTWALELSRYSIRVNAVAPGLIDTILTQQIPAEVKEKFVNRIPLKRIGSTQDIADAISFLVGTKSSYVTGQVLHVDGGLVTGVSGG